LACSQQIQPTAAHIQGKAGFKPMSQWQKEMAQQIEQMRPVKQR
jgi:hypothetical protein